MKILFLTNHLNGDDGYSRYSSDFIKEIQGLGHQVLVLQHPVLAKPLKYLVNPLRIFLTSIKIKKAIKEFSPDIIHFMAEPYVNLLPFLGSPKAKTYLTCHGTYAVIPNLLGNFFKKKISQFLTKKHFQKLTGIITVSNYTKNYLLKYYPETEVKIRVITNGIDLAKHRLLDKKPENKTKEILFVGAVKERKGVLQAIEACRYYRDHFSGQFIYNIVGAYKDNGYSQELFKKIKEYKLDDKIFLRGRITDKELEDYYIKADLFLMPSLNINYNFEGFGLVFLEANAKGVSCIGSVDSGCQEAILEGKTGYLVDPYNPEQIAQKMDLILNQNSINREDCLVWAKQNDIKIKAKELLNFYQYVK